MSNRECPPFVLSSTNNHPLVFVLSFTDDERRDEERKICPSPCLPLCPRTLQPRHMNRLGPRDDRRGAAAGSGKARRDPAGKPVARSMRGQYAVACRKPQRGGINQHLSGGVPCMLIILDCATRSSPWKPKRNKSHAAVADNRSFVVACMWTRTNAPASTPATHRNHCVRLSSGIRALTHLPPSYLHLSRFKTGPRARESVLSSGPSNATSKRRASS